MRHNSHFRLVVEALNSGKSVGVKPLCLSLNELQEIAEISEAMDRNVYIGFNRRESTHVKFIEKEISYASGPIFINYSINAGAIPYNHWVNDPKSGGGRFLGENCHFIDLVMHLVNKPVQEASVKSFRSNLSMPIADNYATSIKFSDGSIANINYFSVGNKRVAKESIFLHRDGNSYEINNYLFSRAMTSSGVKNIELSNKTRG